MAQASKAILPRDVGGPWGKRIGVSVGGSLSWALIVGAYVTGRVNSADWLRYSLVVLNWDDHPNGSWDPVPVQTTIEFRGMQATYTFPVGVTTLWWYAPNEGNSLGEDALANATVTFGDASSVAFEHAGSTSGEEEEAEDEYGDKTFDGSIYGDVADDQQPFRFRRNL